MFTSKKTFAPVRQLSRHLQHLLLLLMVSGCAQVAINPQQSGSVSSSTATIRSQPSNLRSGEQDVVSVSKSPRDTRSYRALTLSNGMKVVLISDPSVNGAAASVHVGVGSNSDPEEFPGLSHFLEHMLFFGTKKYPQPGEYMQFISSHNGAFNANTSYDSTNYFFQVDGTYFPAALDRFSQFFISPLFAEERVDSERNAVNSEFQGGLQDDNRRIQSVLRAVVNQKHPWANFPVGNSATLQDHGRAKLRAALIKHYEQHYSANLMSLSLLGRENLDNLEALARQYFEPIKNKNRRKPVSKVPLFSKGELPKQVNVKTLSDIRAVNYYFPLPEIRQYYKERPADYLANMLGHEAEGSLLKLLRDLGWANALAAGATQATDDMTLFSVTIALTEAGMSKLDEISALLFQYIELIKQAGVQPWLYQELATMAQVSFDYQEPPNPVNMVRGMAEQVQLLPPQDLIRAIFLYEKYDQQMIHALLQNFRTDNVLIVLSDKDVSVTTQEPWYGTQYSEFAVSKERIAQWAQYPRHPQLAIVQPNPFIPEQLALKPRTAAPPPGNIVNNRPQLVLDNSGVKLWHKQDNWFFVPRANFFLAGLTPLLQSSLRNSLLAGLYVNLVNDQLSAFAYPATLAEASFGVASNSRGITMAVNGYSDKQTVLLEALLQSLTKADFQQERFDIIKTEMIRGWQNAELETPYVRLSDSLREVLVKSTWTTAEKITELNRISFTDVTSFIPQLLGSLQLTGLSHGNVTQSEALAMMSLVGRYLRPVSQNKLPGYESVIDLPEQGRAVMDVEIPHEDSALVLYQQAPDDSLQSQALVKVFANLLNIPFFDRLRTQQQLGYVVSVGDLPMLDMNGLVYTIESPVADPRLLEQRINEFLQSFEQTLLSMTPQQFSVLKAGVVNDLHQVPVTLDVLSGRYWGDILLGHESQDRNFALADAVAAVTQEQVVDYYRQHIANPQAGRLVMRSVGMGHQQQFRAAGSESAGTVQIGTDAPELEMFKNSRPVFAYP